MARMTTVVGGLHRHPGVLVSILRSRFPAVKLGRRRRGTSSSPELDSRDEASAAEAGSVDEPIERGSGERRGRGEAAAHGLASCTPRALGGADEQANPMRSTRAEIAKVAAASPWTVDPMGPAAGRGARRRRPRRVAGRGSRRI